MSESNRARQIAVGHTACRAVPVIISCATAVMITFGDSFGGFNPQGLVIVVSLPLLAWAILAPTPGLALAGGLLFLPGVAVWAALLTRADGTTSPSDTDLQQAYPLAASAAVLLALAASYPLRGIRRPRSLPPSRGTVWTIVRILIGVTTLLASVGSYLTLEERVAGNAHNLCCDTRSHAEESRSISGAGRTPPRHARGAVRPGRGPAARP